MTLVASVLQLSNDEQDGVLDLSRPLKFEDNPEMVSSVQSLARVARLDWSDDEELDRARSMEITNGR